MAELSACKTLIYNIQRFCVKDGGGVRTVVFFKGCPLDCLWCSNPESQSYKKEIMHNKFLCRKCGNCVETCKQHAISMRNGEIVIDKNKCVLCGECEGNCYFDAIKIQGKEMTVDEVFCEIVKDRNYYDITGGGVTLSGGECTGQYEFVMQLIRRLKRENISVAIETCGYCETDKILDIVSLSDEVYFDIKLLDERKHIKYTGRSNKQILKNLEQIKHKSKVTIRVPLIKNINMSDKFINDIITLANELKIKKVELLPYHMLGVGKYAQLGREYPCGAGETPSENEINNCIELFTKRGYFNVEVL